MHKEDVRRLSLPVVSVTAACLCRLTGFLKGLGVKAVLDTNTGRDIALLEAAAEFIERYKTAHPELMQSGLYIHLAYGCTGLPASASGLHPLAMLCSEPN